MLNKKQIDMRRITRKFIDAVRRHSVVYPSDAEMHERVAEVQRCAPRQLRGQPRPPLCALHRCGRGTDSSAGIGSFVGWM